MVRSFDHEVDNLSLFVLIEIARDDLVLVHKPLGVKQGRMRLLLGPRSVRKSEDLDDPRYGCTAV